MVCDGLEEVVDADGGFGGFRCGGLEAFVIEFPAIGLLEDLVVAL